jgi:hypothetical protein
MLDLRFIGTWLRRVKGTGTFLLRGPEMEKALVPSLVLLPLERMNRCRRRSVTYSDPENLGLLRLFVIR